MKDKVLVFGGAGFLGSHVADALQSRGYEVSIFDLVKSPYLREGQNFIEGNILDPEAISQAIKGHQYVYHMAGIADIDECHGRPIDAVKMNILGTTYVADACIEHGVKRLIFASSAYVYSDSGSFYRATKQSCENLIECYAEKYGLEYTILRYGSLYGPRSDRRNSLYRICEDAIKKGEILYGGTGEEKREFIHVYDASNMSIQILEPQFKNQRVMLTGVDRITYKDLLSMVEEMMNNKVEIKYIEKKAKTHYKETPYSFTPKFGKKLTINPRVDLGQGLLSLLSEIHEKEDHESKEKIDERFNS